MPAPAKLWTRRPRNLVVEFRMQRAWARGAARLDTLLRTSHLNLGPASKLWLRRGGRHRGCGRRVERFAAFAQRQLALTTECGAGKFFLRLRPDIGRRRAD